MKALTLKKYKLLEIQEIGKPVPKEGEVLIHIRATGICGSDIHGYDGSTGRRKPPIVMGHEASGVIEAVGAGVLNYQPGDPITFDSTIYCGICTHCLNGNVNFCENRRVLGVGCDEYHQSGTFTEYICVPERILHRLPPEVDFEEGAMIEPLSIAVHAVSITPVSSNDTAVIYGAGVIGLLTLQVLLASGCSRVYVCDIDDNRLKTAENMGASATFNTSIVKGEEAVHSLTNGAGADFAIDAVGLSQTVNSAMRSLKKGGTVTVIGNLAPEIEFSLQYLVSRQIRIQGSNASAGEYPRCIELIKNKKVNVRSLISAVADLSEGSEWFERLYKGNSGLLKVILIP